MSTENETENTPALAEQLEALQAVIEEQAAEIRKMRQATEEAAGHRDYTPDELGALDMEGYRRARKHGRFTLPPEEAA